MLLLIIDNNSQKISYNIKLYDIHLKIMKKLWPALRDLMADIGYKIKI